MSDLAYDASLCPKCGSALMPEMETEGRAFMTYEVCVGAFCEAGACDYEFTWVHRRDQ